MSIKRQLVLLTLALCTVRFLFALSNEFWYKDEDVLQIFLIGLKQFTTGETPLYGADLVYTQTQIPGGLQAYLVSALWYVLPLPEAPMITLTVLTTAALALLAWYVCKRHPQLPPLMVWSWILLTSWTFVYCTRIINPSYVIPGSVLFFIGFCEVVPHLRLGVVRPPHAFAMMGFSLLWIYQLHMSWVLLMPYCAAAVWFAFREPASSLRSVAVVLAWFALGAAVPAMFLIPTVLHVMQHGASGAGSLSVVQFHGEHIKEAFSFLTKFFAYGCFDTTRFIGGDTPERVAFLRDYLWAAPFTVLVAAAGVAQAVWMLFTLVRHLMNSATRAFALFILSLYLFMLGSSLFSVATPGGHATLLLFAPVMMFSVHSVAALFAERWFRNLATAVLCSSCVMYAAIAWKSYHSVSLFTNRAPVVRALQERDYRIVGYRRYEPRPLPAQQDTLRMR